jgi:predicted transcriptional regulator
VINLGRHRTRLKILEDILSVISVNNGVRKTKIMYKAYLSYKLLNRYLSDVLEAGLVNCDNNCYGLTEKGRDFLARFNEFSRFRKSVKQQLNMVESKKEELKKMCPNNCGDGVKQDTLKTS